MTKLLEQAFAAASRLPAASQNEIARAVLQLAAVESPPEEIDGAHLSAVLVGLAQAKRREFATDLEVGAAFHRVRPKREYSDR